MGAIRGISRTVESLPIGWGPQSAECSREFGHPSGGGLGKPLGVRRTGEGCALDPRPSSLGLGRGSAALRAFTLIELLVVITIIGLLLTVGLPGLRDFGKSNATMSAGRQMLDDIAFARSRAISGRMNVYMVFIPTNIVWGNFSLPPLSTNEVALATNSFGGQYTSYAFFATRNIGDQPGRSNPRYLTTWKDAAAGHVHRRVQIHPGPQRVQFDRGCVGVPDHDFPVPAGHERPRIPSAVHRL